MFFNNVVLVNSPWEISFAIGIAWCNQKDWEWWGWPHSCDCFKGREGLEGAEGALSQEEQCCSWWCSGQGNFRGLQGFPPYSVREARLRFFAMGILEFMSWIVVFWVGLCCCESLFSMVLSWTSMLCDYIIIIMFSSWLVKIPMV